MRIVNTFAPGGAADILARIVADHLSSAFKQQFFVETRAGAGGVIGVQTVASAEPDGYNFVITTLSLTIIAPFINPKIGYDPIKDLTQVGYIAGTPDPVRREREERHQDAQGLRRQGEGERQSR